MWEFLSHCLFQVLMEMLLKELCPELRAEVDNIWPCTEDEHSHSFWGSTRSFSWPFRSWPITHCHSSRENEASDGQQLFWPALKLTPSQLILVCYEVKKEKKKLSHHEADLKGGTGANLKLKGGKNERGFDFSSGKLFNYTDHIFSPHSQSTNCIFDFSVIYMFSFFPLQLHYW